MGNIVEKAAFLPPSPPTYKHSSVTGYVTIGSGDSGRKIPYHIHHRSENKRSKNLVILLSHGNAEDLGLISKYRAAPIVQACDVTVVTYDYAGYGLSQPLTVSEENIHKPGRGLVPSESSAYQDISAILSHLETHYHVPKALTIVMGISLGSGPTSDAASKNPNLAGCILQSPISSAVKVVMPKTISNSVLRPIDIFPNDRKIQKFQMPTFILHGLADEVVPVTCGKNLFQKLSTGKHKKTACFEPWWIEKCGHNNIESAALEYYIKLSTFFDFIESRVGKTRSPIPRNLSAAELDKEDSSDDDDSSSSSFSSSFSCSKS